LRKTVAVAIPPLPEGSDAKGDNAGRQRLSEAGLTIMALGDTAQIASVRFGTQALRAGWEQGWDVEEVLVPNPNRPSEFWVYVPAFGLLALIWAMQGRRTRRQGTGAAPAVA